MRNYLKSSVRFICHPMRLQFSLNWLVEGRNVNVNVNHESEISANNEICLQSSLKTQILQFMSLT